jgi:predicted component of type VI protein secretion system
MHTLRLYHRENPAAQLDMRTLETGDLAIGRDANAGWVIPDTTAQVSRLHCILAVADGRLTLKDVSSNGVFVGEQRTRAAAGHVIALPDRENLYLGQFIIAVEPATETQAAESEIGRAPKLFRPAMLDMEVLSIPSDWTAIADPQELPVPETQPNATATKPSSAFAAFCAGAKLDPREFAGEDETEVMRRAGAIYQATVIGLSSLMNQRQVAKHECGLDKTKIGTRENNPFKFSATSRLGVDVLRGHKRGFLTGPEALKAAYVDVKKHLISMLAGSRAVLSATLDALAPGRIEENARADRFFLGNKDAAAWKEYERVYTAFRLEALTNPSGCVDKAFRTAYERQLQELEDASDPCTSQPQP